MSDINVVEISIGHESNWIALPSSKQSQVRHVVICHFFCLTKKFSPAVKRDVSEFLAPGICLTLPNDICRLLVCFAGACLGK